MLHKRNRSGRWRVREGRTVFRMRAAIRPYSPGDLSAVLQLWEAAGCMPRGDDGLSVDEAVELIGSERAVTLVGEADGRIIGMVLTTASAPIADPPRRGGD